MLGFNLTIYKLKDGSRPALTAKAPTTARLAEWQTGWQGLDWVEELEKQGKAIRLASGGYPTAYTAQVEHVRLTVLSGPPQANAIWSRQEGDIVTDKWEGKTTIAYDPLSQCSSNEWVLIEAWDES